MVLHLFSSAQSTQCANNTCHIYPVKHIHKLMTEASMYDLDLLIRNNNNGSFSRIFLCLAIQTVIENPVGAI